MNDLRILTNGMVLYQMPFAATPVFSIIEDNQVVFPEKVDDSFQLTTTTVVECNFSLSLRGEDKPRKMRGFQISLTPTTVPLSKSAFYEGLDEKSREALKDSIKSFKKFSNRLKEAKSSDEMDDEKDDDSDVARYQAKVESAARRINNVVAAVTKHSKLDQSDMAEVLLNEYELDSASVNRVVEQCLDETVSLFQPVESIPMMSQAGEEELITATSGDQSEKADAA